MSLLFIPQFNISGTRQIQYVQPFNRKIALKQ